MDSEKLIEAFDARVARRAERRDFFRAAAVGFAVAGAGAGFVAATPAAAQAVTDADILNFALQLEYLEANFYAYATTGAGLPAGLTTGTGTVGTVTPGKQVTFTDAIVGAYAREIAADELAHVTFLRGALAASAVAQPALDLGFAATSAFSQAAQAAGLVAAGTAFDAYASDTNFLLAAYLFEDVGVTAYKGAAPLITSKVYLDAAAGILAAEAYHAATIRETLYAKGVDTPALRSSADAISNARDGLDGSDDLDQGISPTTVAGDAVANIAPLDDRGIAFGRTPQQVLNIVYLTRAQATLGGFFPAGLNGNLRTSAAN